MTKSSIDFKLSVKDRMTKPLRRAARRLRWYQIREFLIEAACLLGPLGLVAFWFLIIL